MNSETHGRLEAKGGEARECKVCSAKRESRVERKTEQDRTLKQQKHEGTQYNDYFNCSSSSSWLCFNITGTISDRNRRDKVSVGSVARKEEHLGVHLARYQDVDAIPLAEGLKPCSQVDLTNSRGKDHDARDRT
jgi:hypothetical protein